MQAQTTNAGNEPKPIDTTGLCLLSLDGGGVRGLSTLFILKTIMDRLNRERCDAKLPSVKPCEVFDLIGGTSTGGLIAIMLGRLEMDVDECISAYIELTKVIFEEKLNLLPFGGALKMRSRFDSGKLKDAIMDITARHGVSGTEPFNDGRERGTKVFVDGALGANNPVDEVEGEASNIWCPDTGDLKPLVKCFISIGTGNPGKRAIEDNLFKFFSKTLVAISKETEETERKFIARWAGHFDQKRFFRFNVEQGLQNVGLTEYKEQGLIEAATHEYIAHQNQRFRVRDCVQNLRQKQYATEIRFGKVIREYEHLILLKTYSPGVFRNIPFPRNQGFVGRDEQLDKLEEMLFSPSRQHKVAITGLGGVGKTQVALEIAYRMQETRPECSIFWIPATNLEALEQACLKIAEQLALPGLEEERADARKLLKDYLCDGNAGQWLLIFDNADDISMWFGQAEANTDTEPCSLSEYIPWSKTGTVLFTTRFGKIAAKLAKQNVIEIPAMDEAQATKLLSERLGDKSLLHQKEEVVLLLKELVYLPLAIVQAASYMNENCVSSIADYRSLLSGQEDGVIDLLSEGFEDDWRTHHNTNPVATTWLISFEQIQRTQPFAADILCFMASIEPADIPQSILPPAPTRKAWTEAIGTLRGYAFVSRRSAAQSFDLHRLVHLATRNWLRKNATLSKWTITALTRLEAIFPSDEHTNRDIWNEYLPHVISLLEREEVKNAKVEIESTRYDLIFKLSMCLLLDGRVTEAVRYLEEHYDWHKRQFDESHPSRLVSQHELAGAYQANGQIAQAVDLLEHVVMVEGKTLAEEDPDRLASQHALGRAYQANGQIALAVDLLKHVVKVKERTFTKEHPSQLASLLASQHALAHAYRANGQITQAVELLEHVVAMRDRTLAEEHPDRLTSQHELASAYQANGQITQAVELLEHVVMVEGRTLAKEHPDRLASQCALASAYEENGQTTQAVELLEHVVAMQDWTTLAEEHPSRLGFQYALARAYRANGQTTQAVELLEHVVMVEGRTLAEEHPSRLASQHELAIAYQATGQITQAMELLEHVVMVEGRTLAEEHPSRLASQHALATVYQANGQIKQAVELLEYVVMVEGRTLAEEHPSLLASEHALASAYQANGQINQAVELLEHVVMVEGRTLAEEHPSRVASQRALTELLLQVSPRSATSNSLFGLSTTFSRLYIGSLSTFWRVVRYVFGPG
ncbi:hypothetical protein CNMCM6936_005054 [Aspergillus lentulus]|uniref:PNPLA domain-containing protein n=1 Tax=Aspergillus lentulus TaxID=293939 RepID=A0AAN5YRQ0_ASPLE|nr:hypothetical protein CNMCM6936_005054 [Aspergillus lentulus]KAF4206113.1 hypothetical protein CNMCM8927_005362 [Aspergillus lentulus]